MPFFFQTFLVENPPFQNPLFFPLKLPSLKFFHFSKFSSYKFLSTSPLLPIFSILPQKTSPFPLSNFPRRKSPVPKTSLFPSQTSLTKFSHFSKFSSLKFLSRSPLLPFSLQTLSIPVNNLQKLKPAVYSKLRKYIINMFFNRRNANHKLLADFVI